MPTNITSPGQLDKSGSSGFTLIPTKLPPHILVPVVLNLDASPPSTTNALLRTVAALIPVPGNNYHGG